MIEYIYKFDYKQAKFNDSCGEKLCFHVDVCILSDKYDIQGLAKLSINKFHVSHYLKSNMKAASERLFSRGNSFTPSLLLLTKDRA